MNHGCPRLPPCLPWLPLLALLLFLAPLARAQAITPDAAHQPLPPANSVAPAPQQTPASRKARQVVDEAIQAMGGEKYLKNTETTGRGLSYSFNSNGELSDPGVPFWSYNRFPGSERLELTKKRNVVYVFNGGKGWEITFKGVAPLARQQVEAANDSFAHSLDMILKRWVGNPQTLMLDQGMALVDVTQVESVSFLAATGENAIVDFSILNHLPIRVRWRKQDAQTGGHYEVTVIYGNWIKQDGIEVPYLVDRYQGNQRQSQVYYTEINFKPIPSGTFIPKPLKK